jgi:hypothetical protein
MQFEMFFKTYLDPLRSEVAEMGAFAGAHGRDKSAAEGRVKKLTRPHLRSSLKFGWALSPNRKGTLLLEIPLRLDPL